MTPDSPLLHLFLAFIVGSVWVTLVTIFAERFGSAVGGLVGGLPSTSAFAFFFIGLNQSPEIAAKATTVFPLAFGFTCSFLLFYAFLAKKGFAFGLFSSLLIWFGLSGLIVISGLENFALSIIGCFLISAATYYMFAKKLRFANLYGAPTHPTPFQLIWRAILGGSVVTLAVFLNQIGGPVFGGIFSAFPAVFSSTLYLVNKSRGIDFSRAMAKPLMSSSVLMIIPYSVAVRYLYPSLGIGLGTIFSCAIVVPFAVVSYLLSNPSKIRS